MHTHTHTHIYLSIYPSIYLSMHVCVCVCARARARAYLEDSALLAEIHVKRHDEVLTEGVDSWVCHLRATRVTAEYLILLAQGLTH
jgi:hypothetical protein